MKKIKRKPKSELKTIVLSIRITPRLSKWLSDNNYAPSGILYEACRDLGYKDSFEYENAGDLSELSYDLRNREKDKDKIK